VLITGINGTLGQATALKLLSSHFNVIGFGHNAQRLNSLFNDVEIIEGNLLDREKLAPLLCRSDILVHLAAQTGFQQVWSGYVQSNLLGTSVLLDLIREQDFPIEKMIFASSSAIYGEGTYRCENHGVVFPDMRSQGQLEKRNWDLTCPICKQLVVPIATDEEKPQTNDHIYALTKQVGERLFKKCAQERGIACICLRFPIIYGTARGNSIVENFLKRISNNEPIRLNEDGNQVRDLLAISDAALAVKFVIEALTGIASLNISIAEGISLLALIDLTSQLLDKKPKLEITQQYRLGDVRHIYLDNQKIRDAGFQPKIKLAEGLKNMVDHF
jgi:dTDP-L-rhamnose 4-epimerase